MSIYMPHMTSMQSTIWPGTMVYIHFTLLPYATEQLCLSHCTCMSHYTFTVVYIQTLHYCTHSWEINKSYFLCHITVKYWPVANMPSNVTSTAYAQFLNIHLWGEVSNIYATYEVAPINEVARITVTDMMMRTTTMMPQPNYIYCIGHLANSKKN